MSILNRSFYARVGRAFGEAARMLMRQKVPRDAAAISFFTLFALFPAILVLIALVDAFLGWMNLHDRVIGRIIALFPGSRALLEASLAEITDPSPAVFLSCLIVTLWSSSWVFSFAEHALNQAWGMTARRTFWERRTRNILLLILGGILLLVSAGFTAAVSTLRTRTIQHTHGIVAEPLLNWFWSSMLLAAGFLIAIAVFCLVYRLMPDKKVPWIEALSGAVVAASLWEGASYIFLKLVPIFDYQRVYGRAGAIIALMTWVYTSNLIMVFGANFSARLHKLMEPAEVYPRLEAVAVGERGTRAKLQRFPRKN